jgi:hypothetical protein
VVAVYDALTVEGVVQERKKVKAGSILMVAVPSASEKPALKLRLGNLQPGENVPSSSTDSAS